MMRRRAGKRLNCFYCGTRSSTRFDGIITEFLCSSCDATNYLDEDGEITDPPASIFQTPQRDRRTPARESPSSSPAGTVFCDTCLKNQHLFTASLAQYLPDDEDDPDNEELERDYYKFRRGLEKRYPQVCEQCEARAQSEIDKAGYTAKTDHLRKMMELSRQARMTQKKTTALDWFNTVGRSLWWAGLVAQTAWHLKNSLEILLGIDSGKSIPKAQKLWLNQTVALLPGEDVLLQASFITGLLSIWWNPQLVQVIRGFTKHLLGLGQWYSFQVIIVLVRFVLWKFVKLDGQSENAQLSAQVVMTGAMVLLYTLATRSIRVDTTPLFSSQKATLSPKPTPSTGARKQEPKGFAEMLNDALDSPTPSRQTKFNSPGSASSPNPSRSPFTRTNRFQNPKPQQSTTPRMPRFETGDEMDWSPTVKQEEEESPHRAFRGSPVTSGRPFGQAPTQDESGPFWYKVPSAPTNPAQRLRNPPNQPSLRARPRETGQNMFFRGAARRESAKGEPLDGVVTFKQPSFFAPAKGNDDANNLADMLGQSFTLSSEGGEELEVKEADTTTNNGLRSSPQRQQRAAIEILVLGGIIIIWLLTLTVPLSAQFQVQVGLLGLAGGIGAYASRTRPAPGLILAGAELAGLAYVSWTAWKGDDSDAGYAGVGILFLMLGHVAWDMFS